MPLTSKIAQRMIRVSQDKARELGVAVSTAIVDADGRLFAFARMEGAPWLSVEVSQAKAFTGALLQRDGLDVQQMPAAMLPPGVVGHPRPGIDTSGKRHHIARGRQAYRRHRL